MPDEPVYVMAYNRRTYLEWCHHEGIDPSSMVYLTDPKQLQGKPNGLSIRLGPRIMDRRDWEQIEEMLVNREALILGD